MNAELLFPLFINLSITAPAKNENNAPDISEIISLFAVNIPLLLFSTVDISQLIFSI